MQPVLYLALLIPTCALGGAALAAGTRASLLYFLPGWAVEDPTLGKFSPRRLLGHAASCDFCSPGWGVLGYSLKLATLWHLDAPELLAFWLVGPPAMGLAWIVFAAVQTAKQLARAAQPEESVLDTPPRG